MAAWIKLSLGMELGLGPGDFVLDGDPAPSPPKGGQSAQFLGHRLGDDLVDWNSGVSIRPYVRPYVHKKFFRFPSDLVCG